MVGLPLARFGHCGQPPCHSFTSESNTMVVADPSSRYPFCVEVNHPIDRSPLFLPPASPTRPPSYVWPKTTWPLWSHPAADATAEATTSDVADRVTLRGRAWDCRRRRNVAATTTLQITSLLKACYHRCWLIELQKNIFDQINHASTLIESFLFYFAFG